MEDKIIFEVEDFQEIVNDIKELYCINANQELLSYKLKKAFLMLAKNNNTLIKQKYEYIIYSLYYDIVEDGELCTKYDLEIDYLLQMIGFKNKDEYFKKEVDIKKVQMDKIRLEEEIKNTYGRKK